VKKLLSLLVVVIMLMSLFSFLGNAADYQWKIQHIRPTGTAVDEDVNWLVDQL